MSDEPLMELQEGELSREGLQAYLDELQRDATDLSLRYQRPGARQSEQLSPCLSDAARALWSGEVRALQLRYRHRGVPWCDTLLPNGDAVRIIRAPQPPVG